VSGSYLNPPLLGMTLNKNVLKNIGGEITDGILLNGDTQKIKVITGGEITCPHGTRYHPQNVRPNRSSGRISVGYWAWMSQDGPGEIAQITPPRFNSHRYCEILEEVMLPTVHNIYPEEERPRFAFVQDNCSIHRANIIMDWFADHPEIDLIRWPSKSPDLNPIENLWGQMILNWGDPFHGARRRAVEELDANVRRVWTMLRGRDYCRNMVAGLRECIDANGYYTCY
jgi:transposase